MDARRRLALSLGVPLAVTAVYNATLRPALLRWGSNPDEVSAPLPGDNQVPRPYLTSTRTLHVRARPEHVWPWLSQLGYGRGGLSSYDWLDRLFGSTSAPSAETVLPAYQSLKVGDVIPLGRGPSWPVTVLDHERALVVAPVPDAVSWCRALEAAGDGSTRLISRVRMRMGAKPLLWLFAPLVDAPGFVMERKMLLDIKRRAESLARGAPPTALSRATPGAQR
jgi:hypothetical protein